MNWKGAIVAGFLPRAASQLSGVHVWREASDLPAESVSTPLFRIEGGLVVLRRMVGIVTTEIEPLINQASVIYRSADDEVVDLGASFDVGGALQGSVLTIPGRGGEPMNLGILAVDQEMDLLCGPGTLELECRATVTGQMRWLVSYVALEPDATVAADYTTPVVVEPEEAPAEDQMAPAMVPYAVAPETPQDV